MLRRPRGSPERRDGIALTVLRRPGAGVFVGRLAELGTLRDALEAAISGHGGLALVSGEATMTRFEFCEMNARIDAQTLELVFKFALPPPPDAPRPPAPTPLRTAPPPEASPPAARALRLSRAQLAWTMVIGLGRGDLVSR